MSYLKILIGTVFCLISSVVFSTDQSVKFDSRNAIESISPASTDLHAEWEGVVEYARANFAQEGLLVIKSDGFVYVKVDDEYIHTLFPMLGLEEEGYSEPPYFRSSEAPGAHISVFYSNENVFPEEVGQSFSFELKEIIIVHPAKNTSYAVLQVYSPELEALRVKYGLSPKLFGHEYHISLAKKVTKR